MARGFDPASSERLTAGASLTDGIPCTLAAWVNPNSGLATFTNFTIIEVTDADGTEFAQLRFGTRGAGNARAHFLVRNDSGEQRGTATADQSYSSGVWVHLCGVSVTTTDRHAYWNGANESTDATSMTDSWTGIDTTIIAAHEVSSTFSEHWDGFIAEAAIWNVALDTSEIAALAAGYSPLLIRPASLVLYVPLVRDNDQDIVGGLSFTANGTPTIETHTRVFYPTLPQVGIGAGGAPPAGIATQRLLVGQGI